MAKSKKKKGSAKNEPAEKWEKSEAKSVLRAGLLFGEITADMSAKQIFNLNPEIHAKWAGKEGKNWSETYSNWCNNLRNLRKQVARDQLRAAEDAAAYGHDLGIAQQYRSDQPVWHREEAAKLIKEDVDEGNHLEMSPKKLWLTREQYYDVFGLEEFRKHVSSASASVPQPQIVSYALPTPVLSSAARTSDNSESVLLKQITGQLRENPSSLCIRESVLRSLGETVVEAEKDEDEAEMDEDGAESFFDDDESPPGPDDENDI